MRLMQAQNSLDVPNVAQQNPIYSGAYCVIVLIMFQNILQKFGNNCTEHCDYSVNQMFLYKVIFMKLAS